MSVSPRALHDALASLATASFQQRERLLSLSLPGASQHPLVVERFWGLEAVNRLFRFTVDTLSSDASFDPTTLVGEELTLRLRLADGSQRAWHGILAGCDALGGDGGLARHRLHLQPWLAHLGLRRDSFVHAQCSARDIVDQVLADYPLAHYAFDISASLPTHPTRVQYRENDLDFLRRTLAEAGLSFRFDHLQDGESDGDDAPVVRHRLVIFDRQATLPDNPQSPIRFHRIDATETQDSIVEWHASRQAISNVVSVSAWDASALQAPHAQHPSALPAGALPLLEHYDGSGAQRYADAEQAGQAALHRLLHAESQAKRYEGTGSARTLAPGQAFCLSSHAQSDPQRRHAVLAVQHEGANNLGAQMAQVLAAQDVEHGNYRNRLAAQDAAAALLPTPRRKPTAPHAMTARVIGMDDAAGEAALHAGRDHRVQVRFHWQPDAAGASAGAAGGLLRAGRHGNAQPSVWLRMAAPVAGPNWGAHLLPRVGTDVLLSFIDGDIDRPVVSHQLHNAADRPPWPAGTDGNANHPGTLSGWHSRGLGGGGYNQWMTDDAPGQVRTRLASSHAASELNLGHLNTQRPTASRRGDWRGAGAELRSDAWVTTRAGGGLLLATQNQARAGGTLHDITGRLGQLEAAVDTARRLQAAIEQAGAVPLAASDTLQPMLDDLDPRAKGRHADTVNGQPAIIPAPGQREGDAPVPAFARPAVVFDAASSLGVSTPASTSVFAGGSLHWTSQQDAHVAAARTLAMASARSAGLFVQQGGLTMAAQHGPVSVQAHTGAMAWQAREGISVRSVDGDVEILAATRITLTGGQTRIELDGADIRLFMPGLLDIKGSTKSFTGPKADPAAPAALPTDSGQFGLQLTMIDHETGLPAKDMRYRFVLDDGSVVEGITGEDGKTEKIVRDTLQAAALFTRTDTEN